MFLILLVHEIAEQNQGQEQEKMEIANYRHRNIEVVRFHEVDILGVCNNAIYFNYFEDARIKSAYLDDELNIYTRINFIKNSSFGFKHIVEKTDSK